MMLFYIRPTVSKYPKQSFFFFSVTPNFVDVFIVTILGESLSKKLTTKGKFIVDKIFFSFRYQVGVTGERLPECNAFSNDSIDLDWPGQLRIENSVSIDFQLMAY